MGLYKRAGSPYWWYSFTVAGHRFRGSTETADRATAEGVEAALKKEAIFGRLDGAKRTMTLDEGFGRYLAHHALELSSADDIDRHAAAILDALGKETKFHEVTGLAIADAIAVWRAPRKVKGKKKPLPGLANGTVNRRLGVMRAVFRKARDAWGVEVAMPKWKEYFLPEPEHVQHVLTVDEERRLFESLRADFHPLVRFALISGARVSNVRQLEWKQVEWHERRIWFRVKSKRPGGGLRYLPLTDALAAILSVERGRHPIFVFTYVCDRNRYDPERKEQQRKGERYPFSRDGWRRAWQAALNAAKIGDFRFHDLRHTAGTRTLRATGNLKLVQKMLGHQDIKTTLRYTIADVDDIRAGMDAVASQSWHSAPPAAPETEKKSVG